MAPNARKTKTRASTSQTRGARRATSSRANSAPDRARSTSSSVAAAKSAPRTESTFTCPDCGRSFARAAALGAHRRQAHGVAGTSASSRANGSRSRNKPSANGRQAQPERTQRVEAAVDRNLLLRALFPNGIPPDEAVIRSVNSWLDEADRLASTR